MKCVSCQEEILAAVDSRVHVEIVIIHNDGTRDGKPIDRQVTACCDECAADVLIASAHELAAGKLE